MDGCESNDLSEDALPLPAMLEVETQSVTAETSSQNVYEQSEHTDQTNEMQDHSDEQTSPKRLRFQATGGNDSEKPMRSVFSEISPPHDRWAFNLLIVNLSKHITEEEFRQMKEMYKGDIPRGVLDKFKTPMDLFDMMQKINCLTPVNLLQLEGLFWNLGRQDLMDMVIEYGRKTGNVIYMQPASSTPVNGYTAVKFHVCGKNFNDMTKKELWYLRTVVANTVLIPSSFVLIDGVDPSSSITVTLLIPDQHADILKKMLQAKEIDMTELIEFGVDSITIKEDVYLIAEHLKAYLPAYTEQSQVDVIVKLQKAKDTISNLESEIIKQKDTIKELDTRILCLQAQNDTFKRSAKPKDLFPEAESMGEDPDVIAIGTDIPDALLKFSKTLEEMSKENCNKELVLQLLQAHVTLIAARCYQELSMIINKLVMQAQNLMIFQGTHVALQHFIRGQVREENVPNKALKEISEKLRLDERRILQKEYNWTTDDTEAFQKGSLPFLLFLLLKESRERKTGAVNIIEFLRKCLIKVNRTDLLLEFLESIAKYSEENIEEPGISNTTETHVEVQSSRETKIEEIAKNVNKILEKMNTPDEKMYTVPELGKIARGMKGEYPHWLNKLLYADLNLP